MKQILKDFLFDMVRQLFGVIKTTFWKNHSDQTHAY